MFNDHVACVSRVKHLTRPAPQVLWCLRRNRRASPALDLKRCSWCRTLMISAFFPTFFQSFFGNAGWCDDYGLYYTILYCTILYYAILHFIISYHIILYHIILYYIVLYYIAFHYITLNYIYIYTSGFRRNQVYASWKLDKASIYIHLGQLRITFPSPFCVAGVGRSNITWF